MSNYVCAECGTEIREDSDGWYVTECPHWPMSPEERVRAERAVEKEKGWR